MSCYHTFLKEHKLTKESLLKPTHTRIGDKELGVYGGSYHIPPEDLPKFYELYEEHVIRNKNLEYLTEKQSENVFAVDFDFRYEKDTTVRHHRCWNYILNNLIRPFIIALAEYCVMPDKVTVYIMEKPNVNKLPEYTKDGIHMIIGCRVAREIQEQIRDKIIPFIKKLEENRPLPIINVWEDVIDEAITSGRNNWQLYGSRKPGHEAYELTCAYEVSNMNSIDPDELPIYDEIFGIKPFPLITVQNTTFPLLQPRKDKLSSLCPKNKKRSIRDITLNAAVVGDGLTKEEELLYMIRIDPKARPVWLWICSCIKYNNMTNENWEKFGELNGLNWDTEKEKLFDYCRTDPKNNDIYCLQCYAKKNNPEQYKLWLERWNVYQITAQQVKDPFACSKVIYKSLKHSLRLCNESWFMLQNNNLWKSQKEPSFFIVDELHKYLDHGRNQLNNLLNNTQEGDEAKLVRDQLKEWLGFYQLVSSNSYVSGITRFLKTMLVDDKFSETLNVLKGKLAFQNGIMDLETKTFREGIRWDDYITETIPHDYNSVDNTDFVKEKLQLIVNNNEEHLEYHLSVFGFSFIGMPDLMKSVFFHIDKTNGGRGDNGKSFFFSILNELMPNYVYKSKASFLDKHNKTIHKQLSHIKGKRLIFLEEMPKTQAMNHSLFKEIGDGTTIENEVMYGTCEKIKVQGVLHALSNHIPDLSAEEEACYNRYRQISYNSHFDRTGTRTEANFEKLEFIADETLKDKIINEHADEVFNLLIEYAHKFFARGKKLPPIPTQFSKDTKETKDLNDKFGVWFSENMEIGGGYKAALKKMEWESKFSLKEIKEGMKRKGFVYNSDLCGIGKNEFDNKYYKGGFEGVRIVDDTGVGSST